MAKLPPIEIELVVWHDAVADSCWADQGDEATTDRVNTVGVVLKETPEYIVIAGSWGQSQNDTLQSNARMTIPKGMLIRRQTYVLRD